MFDGFYQTSVFFTFWTFQLIAMYFAKTMIILGKHNKLVATEDTGLKLLSMDSLYLVALLLLRIKMFPHMKIDKPANTHFD